MKTINIIIILEIIAQLSINWLIKLFLLKKSCSSGNKTSKYWTEHSSISVKFSILKQKKCIQINKIKLKNKFKNLFIHEVKAWHFFLSDRLILL